MPPLTTTARQLLNICLFRAPPQKLPYSWELFTVTLSAMLAMNYLAMQAYGPAPNAASALLVGLLFTLGFIYAILLFLKYTNRFVQTASAIFGTGAIITLVSLPVLYGVSAGALQDPYTFFALAALGIWRPLVMGHILRHALSWPLPGGILVAIGYFVSLYLLGQFFHG